MVSNLAKLSNVTFLFIAGVIATSGCTQNAEKMVDNVIGDFTRTLGRDNYASSNSTTSNDNYLLSDRSFYRQLTNRDVSGVRLGMDMSEVINIYPNGFYYGKRILSDHKNFRSAQYAKEDILALNRGAENNWGGFVVKAFETLEGGKKEVSIDLDSDGKLMTVVTKQKMTSNFNCEKIDSKLREKYGRPDNSGNSGRTWVWNWRGERNPYKPIRSRFWTLQAKVTSCTGYGKGVFTMKLSSPYMKSLNQHKTVKFKKRRRQAKAQIRS